MRATEHKGWSEAGYLASEDHAVVRHEYCAGELFAMPDSSRRHNRIAGNLAVALSGQLEAGQLKMRDCQVFMSGVKLRCAHGPAYYYPDVMMCCGDEFAIADNTSFTDTAQLVVEVLSPSTEAIDRREKLRAYRNVPGLVEYALVSQSERRVELYRRQGDIGWLYLDYEPGDTVEFGSVGARVAMDELYAGTAPDPADPAD